MNPKSASPCLLSSLVLVLLVVGVWLGFHFGITPFAVTPSSEPPSKRGNVSSDNKPSPVSVPPAANGILRYDPSKDPAFGGEAARLYYEKRKEMFIAFWGPQPIARIMDSLKNGEDLHSNIGLVGEIELVEALSLVRSLLSHEDRYVRRAAAKVLCRFNDKAGFDFLIKMRSDANEGLKWNSLLEEVFEPEPRSGYNETLTSLMRARNVTDGSPNVDAVTLAELLARLGDTTSLEVILPTFHPSKGYSPPIVLKHVRDERIVQPMREILATGKTERAKEIAAIVLAAQGQADAQEMVANIVGRLAVLPKSVTEPTTISEANPARDPLAFYVLREGIDAVPPAMAVPVLRDIGLKGNYHEYVQKAIEQLAKIGEPSARDALMEIAQSMRLTVRGFEESCRIPVGQALLLFNDEASTQMAQTMFGHDKVGFKANKFVAEAKGWKGIFGQYHRF